MPKLSVIILAGSHSLLLRRSLNSVCGQSWRDLEIICPVNAFETETSTILREYAAKDERIIVMPLPKEVNGPALCTLALKTARGEYISFLNGGDCPEQDFYAKLFAKIGKVVFIERFQRYVWKKNNISASMVKGRFRSMNTSYLPMPDDCMFDGDIQEDHANSIFIFRQAIYQTTLFTEHEVRFLAEFEDILRVYPSTLPFASENVLPLTTIDIVDDAIINIDPAHSDTPDETRILEFFDILLSMLNIIAGKRSDGIISDDTYALICAVAFHSVMVNALRKQTAQAFTRIVQGLYRAFSKVHLYYACAPAFDKYALPGLYMALSEEKISALAAWLMPFYDKAVFDDYALFYERQHKQNPNRQASVVIPVYSGTPSDLEVASLRQCLNVLGAHHLVFFGPKSLNTAVYEQITRNSGADFIFEPFPDYFFTSTITYSQLLMDSAFYTRFLHSEYLLIYQLDAFVFRDELTSWCDKGYDYIGAPLFEKYDKAEVFSPFLEPSGNGGFSLRRVRGFIHSLHTLQQQLCDGSFNEHCASLFNMLNEDVFSTHMFPQCNPHFSIAPASESKYFSFELLPERLYKLTKKLPFGCHAFNTYSPEFWERHIPALHGMRLQSTGSEPAPNLAHATRRPGAFTRYPDLTGKRMAEGGLRLKGLPRALQPGTPLVSVVTTVRNGEKHLAQCMQSVFAQNYPNIEYIVTDAASTDSTLALLQQHEDKIDYYVSEPDDGIYAGMNKGIELAAGEYILVLNADDYYHSPDAVATLALAAHTGGHEVVMGGNYFIYTDGHGEFRHPRLDSRLFLRCTLFHESMLIHKDVYTRCGLYDESYPIIADWVWMRLHLSTTRNLLIQDCITCFRAGGSSGQDTLKHAQEKYRMLAPEIPGLTFEDYYPLRYPHHLTHLEVLNIMQKYGHCQKLRDAFTLFLEHDII